jgi:predicted SAM-dependent methyltransferase
MLSFIQEVRWFIKHKIRVYKLRKLTKKKPCKIVVGSSGIFDAGWIPSNIDTLNLIKSKDWETLFNPDSIDAILAEHIWEHLSVENGIMAAKMCFKYLRHGGYLRAAVPDGLHPDPKYIEWTRVGGTGPGAQDHKILYTYKTFRSIFEVACFKVELYEYFDEQGVFHYNEWSPDKGKIYRSKRFDERNQDDGLKYTSIILDAKKE